MIFGNLDAAAKWPAIVNKQDVGKDQSFRDVGTPRAEESVSVEQATEPIQMAPVAPANHRPRWKRRLALGALAALALAAIWKFGVPWIELTLNTVSTDDAYVNGHVTFVAARVSGQVARVLVDDNNRVRKGEVLVQLDREPYEVVVAEKRAAVETAKADLLAAAAAMHGLEAQARGQYWQLQNAMEDVDNRVALLHARVAALNKSNAKFKLAQLDFARAEQLLPSQTISQQEYDRRQAELSESQAEVTQAMADVDQIRVSLGLPKKPDSGELGSLSQFERVAASPFPDFHRSLLELLIDLAGLGDAARTNGGVGFVVFYRHHIDFKFLDTAAADSASAARTLVSELELLDHWLPALAISFGAYDRHGVV